MSELIFGRWNPLFFEGIELFNKKEFFKAHEEWEKLWMATAKDDALSDFYKAMIQAAAVFEHIRRHNLRGAAGLLATCLPILERYAPRTQGLDVAALIADLEQARHQVLNTDDFTATRQPQLKLWLDSTA
ncbi:MAG: DUF309 domain-containing protein [Candidatus Omnitrophica bacterium]|nr:DUF309 domain-containing protein [Candidatus Omnitrophota bacterium]